MRTRRALRCSTNGLASFVFSALGRHALPISTNSQIGYLPSPINSPFSNGHG
ncbi:MAG: hypothetical protein IPK82_19385 [Polyangiaceae bacterium]|nr:hypothetical protein [Polyangiaceae bacterium]